MQSRMLSSIYSAGAIFTNLLFQNVVVVVVRFVVVVVPLAVVIVVIVVISVIFVMVGCQVGGLS